MWDQDTLLDCLGHSVGSGLERIKLKAENRAYSRRKGSSFSLANAHSPPLQLTGPLYLPLVPSLACSLDLWRRQWRGRGLRWL